MGVRLGLAIATGAMAGWGSSSTVAAEMPGLVSAYATQLAQQCGPLPPGAATPNLVERIDLNGDKVDDWIVDASRYPCPGRPAISAQAGSQVTVFRGIQDGVAVPALQRVTFGSRVQRTDGQPALWLSLAGADCGSGNDQERCERQVVWRSNEQRFELAVPKKDAAAR